MRGLRTVYLVKIKRSNYTCTTQLVASYVQLPLPPVAFRLAIEGNTYDLHDCWLEVLLTGRQLNIIGGNNTQVVIIREGIGTDMW